MHVTNLFEEESIIHYILQVILLLTAALHTFANIHQHKINFFQVTLHSQDFQRMNETANVVQIATVV